MGNEFGHPEWIDFPREGNNWSFKYAKRQWSLKHNSDLRYHYLSDFEKDMLHIIRNHTNEFENSPLAVRINEPDKLIAFARGSLLFIYNFHPTTSYTDYGIQTDGGKYRIILDTDSEKYGGQNRIDNKMTYYSTRLMDKASQPFFLKLYIPARTAMVLKKIRSHSIYDV
jgi:1,4-alpha-glucan branching enzyme